MTSNHERLMFDIAVRRGLDVEDIKGPSRRPEIVAARREFCFRARHEFGMTFAMIAQAVNRQVSSVHALIAGVPATVLESGSASDEQ